eukprot:14758667-Alexandrium_andersonii.AAC.1
MKNDERPKSASKEKHAESAAVEDEQQPAVEDEQPPAGCSDGEDRSPLKNLPSSLAQAFRDR